MVHGILGYGVFTYKTAADGTVAITLSNNWDKSYPQKWNVTYGNETITAKGIDGQTLTLVRADDETMAILNSFLEQNGGGDKPKYNVDDYKPQGVDNSQWMKEFLAANPSEFCLLTVDLSATSDKTAWGKEFTELVNSVEFRSMFADFKPRLTVGEMRGHVLMLSLQKYAEQPVGGYCYGWVVEKGQKELMKGHITGADGVETPLWVQDFWGKWDRVIQQNNK